MAPDPRKYKRPGTPQPAAQQSPLLQQLLQMQGSLFGPMPEVDRTPPRVAEVRSGMSPDEVAALFADGGVIPYSQQAEVAPMDLSALNAARDALLESELAARKGLVDDARQQARRAAAIHAFTAFPVAAMQLAGAGVEAPDTRTPMLQAMREADALAAQARGQEGVSRAQSAYDRAVAEMEEMARVAGENREIRRGNVDALMTTAEQFREALAQMRDDEREDFLARAGLTKDAANILLGFRRDERDQERLGLERIRTARAGRTTRGDDGVSAGRLRNRIRELRSFLSGTQSTDPGGENYLSPEQQRIYRSEIADLEDAYVEEYGGDPAAPALNPDGSFGERPTEEDFRLAHELYLSGELDYADYADIYAEYTGRPLLRRAEAVGGKR